MPLPVRLPSAPQRPSALAISADVLRQVKHINTSLWALGTVIERLSALGPGQKGHVPYRDSVLTRLLQVGARPRTPPKLPPDWRDPRPPMCLCGPGGAGLARR